MLNYAPRFIYLLQPNLIALLKPLRKLNHQLPLQRTPPLTLPSTCWQEPFVQVLPKVDHHILNIRPSTDIATDLPLTTACISPKRAMLDRSNVLSVTHAEMIFSNEHLRMMQDGFLSENETSIWHPSIIGSNQIYHRHQSIWWFSFEDAVVTRSTYAALRCIL